MGGMSNSHKGKDFLWKDQYNNFHLISEMPTPTLFHTTKMVWNHCAPSHSTLPPHIHHTFDVFYTDEYMVDGVKAMVEELMRRGEGLMGDVEVRWMLDLGCMVRDIDEGRLDAVS